MLPVEQSKLDPNAKSFQFKIESDFDFPALVGEGDDNGFANCVVDQSLDNVSSANSSENSAYSLQKYLITNGFTSHNRVNFSLGKYKSSSKYNNNKFTNGASSGTIANNTTNGHFTNNRTLGQTNTTRANIHDEEWPSLNSSSNSYVQQSSDISILNNENNSSSAKAFGKCYNQQVDHSLITGDSINPSDSSTFSYNNEHRFNYREKLTNTKITNSKKKCRFTAFDTASGNNGNSASTNTTKNATSTKYNVTLKGFF